MAKGHRSHGWEERPMGGSTCRQERTGLALPARLALQAEASMASGPFLSTPQGAGLALRSTGQQGPLEGGQEGSWTHWGPVVGLD